MKGSRYRFGLFACTFQHPARPGLASHALELAEAIATVNDPVHHNVQVAHSRMLARMPYQR